MAVKGKFEIAASIMCADLFHLERDLLELMAENVEYFHLDIMEGAFVDNMTLGLSLCRDIARYGVPRDVHFLTLNPERYIERLKLGPGEYASFHYESGADVRLVADMLHATGARMGVVLNPETPVDVLAPYLDVTDMVVLMMIRPGMAGRPMEPGMIEKIGASDRWLKAHADREIPIEVDGHVNTENAGAMYRGGASIGVAGTSAVFRPDFGIREGVRRLRAAALEQ